MDVGELLKYQPQKGAKRRVPDQFERRPKAKRISNNEEEPETYQFKKILKKGNSNEPKKVSTPAPSTQANKDVSTVKPVKDSPAIKSVKVGMTDDEKEKLLSMVENDDEGEAINESTIKKYILTFEKKVTKNQEMRIKFPDQPPKFMESEMELHDEIQKLHVLATVPEYYETFIKLNAVSTVLGLLNHPNTDIAIAVVHLLQELTDTDTLQDSEEEAMFLVDALLEGQVTNVLLQNLQRLDERQKEDFDGVHHTLAVIENLAEFHPDVCITAGQQGLLTWLLKRLKRKVFDNNKLYASEIIAIMLQNHEENRQLLGESNGVDSLLQALAAYKGHNPNNQEETEYMENLFSCLCSSLLFPPNKDLFLKGEGLQLMILMLREKKMSRTSALKVLAYTMTGENGGENCNKFVDILGLRCVFPLFMKPPKRNKKTGNSKEECEEHTCSIIASLFRHLTGSNRSRLVQKFVEEDHIKLDRLMELYFKYQRRVQDADARIEREKDDLEEQGELIDEAMEDMFYLKRLDAGLFILQLIVCIMLEACCSGVASIKQRVITLMSQHGGSMKQIKQVMREYAGHIGDTNTNESAEMERRRLLSLVDRF
ncbi:beta-catenin-like protein 1 [Hydra vulgaris]|uniref:Beta-catenin-like protein 1 n=1 Tax=Hydra vulgaris TaxID=6087 RepID=T2M8K9_HYDVU|nr:beta-catenin-like protein 1 [Hydra vulgaris]